MTDPITPITIARLRELTGWRGNSDDDGEHEEDLDLADWQIRAIYSALQSGAIPIPDDAPQLAAQAAEIERVKFEREALVNAAICGQRSLHSDMINRWGDLRDAVLHGLDGLDNDQTNAVLGCIDDHFPSDIKPAVAEESSDTENRADKAEARVEKLEALLLAVKCGEFSGITCDNVNGRCWFDARDAALAKREGGR